MRISDWSSDVCSSDLLRIERVQRLRTIERHQGDGAARFDEKGFVGHSYLLRHSGEGRNLDGGTPACAGVTVQVRGVHLSFSGKGAKIASTQSSVTASGVGGSHFGLLSLSMINARTPSMKSCIWTTRLPIEIGRAHV